MPPRNPGIAFLTTYKSPSPPNQTDPLGYTLFPLARYRVSEENHRFEYNHDNGRRVWIMPLRASFSAPFVPSAKNCRSKTRFVVSRSSRNSKLSILLDEFLGKCFLRVRGIKHRRNCVIYAQRADLRHVQTRMNHSRMIRGAINPDNSRVELISILTREV